MKNNKNKLPQVSRGAKIDTPLDKSHHIPTHAPGGQVQTNWANIRWTKKKIIFVSLLLGTPYVIALIVSWVAIGKLITYILLGVAVLFGLVIVVLRSLDSEEF